MSQVKDNKVTDPSVRKLFEGKNFVFISSIMRDGFHVNIVDSKFN